jgi:hypothetical protein
MRLPCKPWPEVSRKPWYQRAVWYYKYSTPGSVAKTASRGGKPCKYSVRVPAKGRQDEGLGPRCQKCNGLSKKVAPKFQGSDPKMGEKKRIERKQYWV